MRRPAAAALAALFVLAALSQTHARGLCGTVLLERQTDPRPSPAERAARPAVSHSIGERERLDVYDFGDEVYHEVDFTYRAVGAHSYVLVQNTWWYENRFGGITPSDVERISAAFEKNAGLGAGVGKGIYDIETGTYAGVAPVGGDSMVYIALCEISSYDDGTYIVGYVNDVDRYDPDTKPNSNYRNIVYLDVSKTPDVEQETTLAHEFTHIVQAGADAGEDRWIDEGVAVYSQALCGYEGNSGEHYFEDTKLGLYEGDNIPSLAVYDMSYLIIQFMGDQYGASFVGELLRCTSHGIKGIDEALAKAGIAATFSGDVFPAWAVANLLPPDADSPYSYRTYDPRAWHPGDFGEQATIPFEMEGSLKSFGLRYVRVDPQWLQGALNVSDASRWMVLSVAESGRPDAACRAIVVPRHGN